MNKQTNRNKRKGKNKKERKTPGSGTIELQS
jgi:hypothetical protein